MDQELIKIIDENLDYANDGGIIILVGSTALERKAKDYLITRNWIAEVSKGQYKITEKGNEVVETGGYLAYQNEKIEAKEKEDKLKDLSIKQLSISISQIKHWKLVLAINLVVSGLVGFLTGNFDLVSCWFKEFSSWFQTIFQ